MRNHHKSVCLWLAIMIGILPTVVAAQDVNQFIAQQHEMIRLVIDNILLCVGLLLGMILVLGKILDFYRSLRSRRAGTAEEME